MTDFGLIKEDIIENLPLKDFTEIGDTIIIIGETPDARSFYNYANILSFEQDVTKRNEWWHIKICVLFPFPEIVVWTLRTEQINGEVFTMNGLKRFIRAIDFEKIKSVEQLNIMKGQTSTQKEENKPETEENEKSEGSENSKVLNFNEIKRRR